MKRIEIAGIMFISVFALNAFFIYMNTRQMVKMVKMIKVIKLIYLYLLGIAAKILIEVKRLYQIYNNGRAPKWMDSIWFDSDVGFQTCLIPIGTFS